MGMFRYKTRVVADTSGSPNLYGHGIGGQGGSGTLIHSLTPAFDFYDGATFLFRLHGINDTVNKTANPIKAFFDASIAGSVISQSSPAWPSELHHIVCKRSSDNLARWITSPASLISGQTITSEGFDNGGATSRFASLYLTRDTDGSGDNAGAVYAEDEEVVFEISGDFTHVETVYPWPVWIASDNNYDEDHVFTALETGSQPKIYSLAAAAPSGQTSFDAFVSNNAAAFTANIEVEALGGGVFQIETDFNAPTANPLQLKETQNVDNDVLILKNEPLVYLDTVNGSPSNTGFSRQSPLDVLPVLSDNVEVLVMAGSTIGGQTFINDAVLTVQNSVLQERSGGASPEFISNDFVT